MDCTLKIIAGPEAGQEFPCGPETYLGRSQRCLIRLSSPGISFEHALVSRVGDDYFVENLSANGTFLNGQKLLAKTRLRLRDQIQLGDTVARVEKLPAAQGASSSRRWLLLTVIVMLIVGAVVVVVSDSTPTPQGQRNVYNIFYKYAQDQVARDGMPPDVPVRLADAWRYETAGDREQATKAWVSIHLLLDKWDTDQHRRPDPLHSTRGLQDLQSGKDTYLQDDDMRIAFKQWIGEMERPH